MGVLATLATAIDDLKERGDAAQDEESGHLFGDVGTGCVSFMMCFRRATAG
jgi:hypothetical protein